MHELLTAKAAAPAPAIVLGLLLRPYSIGHELMLWRFKNPLAESRPCSPEQLAQAVWICSSTWNENRKDFLDPCRSLKLGIWKLRRKFGQRISIVSELAFFLEYQRQGSLEPPIS